MNTNVTVTFSMKQAAALLYAAEIGDKRIREAGLPGAHRARDGAMRILSKTMADRLAVMALKAPRAGEGEG